MLPAKIDTQSLGLPSDPQVRPGSWWRLVDAEHALAERNAPDHGLILMVSEVRIIDGEMHTIVLHAHPLWMDHHSMRDGVMMLVDEFLTSFAAEPNGEALRQAELDGIMGDVAQISDEMRTPPAPELLLAAQKERQKDDKEEAALPKDGEVSSLPSKGYIPAALLPSQDVVEAQKAIEDRIAAFTAQKDWITGKTDEIKGKMTLISHYQMEKVNGTLASISEETTRAHSLLENVQTMRLFLGEDMHVTPLLDGKSADPSEPLTFMQRMLFLDEEIYISNLMQGFSSDDMDPRNLSELFSEDFSLVERMLPYERSVAITRVRRNGRDFGGGLMTIQQLFTMIEKNEADQRIHIFVRDGQRLHMITADEVTSNAERLFPSKDEIEALFKTSGRFGQEVKAITPDQVEYSDARADHDKRALFYKRFLILLWGVFERSDVMGPFMPKGGNWLAATTHSEHFRFIHDEEDVLEDGRPTITEFINKANANLVAGSRVAVKWHTAMDALTAPTVMEASEYRSIFKKGEPKYESSVALAYADGNTIKVKAPMVQRSYHSADRLFHSPVLISQYKGDVDRHPDAYVDHELTEGFMCIDDVTVADLDYYINSRKARIMYASYMAMINEARTVLLEEQDSYEDLRKHMISTGLVVDDAATFEMVTRRWRRANNWKWPIKPAQFNALGRLYTNAKDRQPVEAFIKGHESVLYGGMKTNGSIFVVVDNVGVDTHHGAVTPWVREYTYTGVSSKIPKAERIISYSAIGEVEQLTLYTNQEGVDALLDRIAPMVMLPKRYNKPEAELGRAWKTPIGLYDAKSADALGKVAQNTNLIALMNAWGNGEMSHELNNALTAAYQSYKSDHGAVILPKLVGDVAVITGVTETMMPRSWLLSYTISISEFAWALGYEDDVRKAVGNRYRDPEKVCGNIEARSRNGGVILTARALRPNRPLSALYNSDLFLSFDEMGSGLGATSGVPLLDPALTWQDVLARNLCSAGDEMNGHYAKSYSLDLLKEKSADLTVIAPDGMENLTKRIFDRNRGK